MKLQRGESRWRTEKEEREENRKNERDEREISGEIEGVKYIYIYIFFFFCNTVNNTILCLELYYNSSIAKKFAILPFTTP